MMINSKQENRSTTRLAWRLEDAAKAIGVSVQFLRKEIRAQHLQVTRLGRCVVILDVELRRYLKGDN